eukprot:scaffold61141_cov66-Phaeocystis_antarctica.AAC.2
MAAGGGCHPTHLLAELLGVRCVSKGGFLGGSCLLGQLKKKWVTSPGPGPLYCADLDAWSQRGKCANFTTSEHSWLRWAERRHVDGPVLRELELARAAGRAPQRLGITLCSRSTFVRPTAVLSRGCLHAAARCL